VSGTTDLTSIVGIAFSGVAFYQGLNSYNVDPIYPAVYGMVTNITSAIEKLDTCMGHTPLNNIYHYHIAPTCLNMSSNLTRIS
jgi:hypothetical protein